MPAAVPTLEVDTSAIIANYRLLKDRHAQHKVAAVVKADAYGLGSKAVSAALWEEGCRVFFVATLSEGMALRRALPDARIGVFNGLLAGEETTYVKQRLAPVLNDRGQVERWMAKSNPGAPLMLHVDTGMTRLGLTQAELAATVAQYPALTASLAYVLSHLACGNDPGDAKTAEQLARFREALALLPGVKASLANSSGHFLTQDFHFELGRPGCALYGITPVEGVNPMRPVARLSAPILQIRELDRDETVGYGATATLGKGSRLALAALGYADGWPRALSNTGHAYVAGIRVPVLGRVSMDMTALDVSAVPHALVTAQTRVEFINAQQTVDDVAAACGTIGYEIYTGLGARVERRYSTALFGDGA
jgi:alanine racemase